MVVNTNKLGTLIRVTYHALFMFPIPRARSNIQYYDVLVLGSGQMARTAPPNQRIPLQLKEGQV